MRQLRVEEREWKAPNKPTTKWIWQPTKRCYRLRDLKNTELEEKADRMDKE